MLTIDININSIINQDPLCLTIGNFDGVHNGHKFVFDKLITESKKLNIPSAVLSFDPHPRQFFEKNKQHFNIVTEDKKIKLIESLGIDIYYKLKFDNDVSSMSAEDFVNKFLVNSLKIKSLIIGENFRFGKNRNGDTGLLKELSLEKKFSVHIINYIKSDSLNMIYSS
ncbi:MAG: Riboflavin biosynthesis protein RibF, partial [Alphaproteobacteria bacterium MarineAlpha5_Bin11]